MTPRKSGPEKRADELLELWMGEPEEPPARGRHIPGPVLVASAALAGLIILVMAKLAADALLIGLALLGTGLVLHVLGTWLAESDLLSPGWFTIIVLAAALGGWALFYPAEGLEGFGRYVPKPVSKFFEWSESKGWGQRVLIGPGTGGAGAGSSVAPLSSPASPPSRPVEAPPSGLASGPSLSITASASTVRQGQALVLTARLTGAPTNVPPGVVTFYDGLRPLGQAPLVPDGRTRAAALTVRLAAGEHRLTASVGLAGPRSEALRVSVLQ